MKNIEWCLVFSLGLLGVFGCDRQADIDNANIDINKDAITILALELEGGHREKGAIASIIEGFPEGFQGDSYRDAVNFSIVERVVSQDVEPMNSRGAALRVVPEKYREGKLDRDLIKAVDLMWDDEDELEEILINKGWKCFGKMDKCDPEDLIGTFLIVDGGDKVSKDDVKSFYSRVGDGSMNMMKVFVRKSDDEFKRNAFGADDGRRYLMFSVIVE